MCCSTFSERKQFHSAAPDLTTRLRDLHGASIAGAIRMGIYKPTDDQILPG